LNLDSLEWIAASCKYLAELTASAEDLWVISPEDLGAVGNELSQFIGS
jgi:hypothetical protein